VLCGLVVWAAIAAPPAAAAVADYIGKPVAAVRIVVEGRESNEPLLMSIVETGVGQTLSMAQVRETVAHLFSLGRFEGVSVDGALDAGRVTLRYDLVPIHAVSRIRFEGQLNAPGVDTGDMRRAIADRYGVSPPLGRLSDMTRILSDVLRERGYLHASVAPRAEINHDSERATIVFDLGPGARTTIGAVEVVGRPTVSRDEFLRRLGVSPGAPYQHEALNAGIEKYVDERRRAGYYEAAVLPLIRLSEDERVADLTLTVTPGPHVRVEFKGDPLDASRRADLVPVMREGSVDEDLLEDSSNRIEEFLKAQGYRDAAAPHTRNETGDELVVIFSVTHGQQYRIATLEIAGNASMPSAELQAIMKIREGQPFSDALLESERQAIIDVYRRYGYARVEVRSVVEPVADTPPPAQVPVRVRLNITEGPRTTVEAVTFSGNRAFADEALRAKLELRPGVAYQPAKVGVDRDRVQLEYQNAGYEATTVDARPEFSDNDTRVAITYVINEGPQVFVDHVLIVGNVRTSTAIVERELQLRPNDPFSLAAVNESQRRLAALGLFRRVRITELPHGGENKRDLLVTVEESPPTTVGYGGGGEFLKRLVPSGDPLAPAESQTVFAPRAFVQLGRRNLFGKNRSLNIFASISQPTIGADTTTDATEYRLIGTVREPRIFDTAADLVLNATLERQIRSSFTYRLASTSAELARRLTKSVAISGVYQLQRTVLEDVSGVQPLIDRLFTTVRLSSFTVSIARDTRDDQVNPQEGQYLSASGQLAARSIGSEVGFAKSVLTAQTFHVIPQTHGVIFAGNARLGLAVGFPRDVTQTFSNGETVTTVTVTTKDLPEPERFFAGGDSTARGFALDTLGRPETIVNGFPTGGNGLVLFNAELRVPIGNSQVVTFLDTGNVFLNAEDIDFAQLRSSAGMGFRARFKGFPLLRFDWGFKIHPEFGEDKSAWFISVGHAF
jgi:outer membrane protein assembly complex protein YaeT